MNIYCQIHVQIYSGPRGKCKPCTDRCPAQWEKRFNHCFRTFTMEKTWSEAERYCQSQGGHLASVTSRKIHNYLNGKGVALWVGGTDEDQEGSWFWSDCSDWRFTLWGVMSYDTGLGLGSLDVQQPNNGLSGMVWPQGREENCLQIGHRKKEKWHDVVCNERQYFVCSKKLCPQKGKFDKNAYINQ